MTSTTSPATASGLHGRSLLKEVDFTREEFLSLIDLAAALRLEKRTGTERRRMVGRNIALIFEKASTRTRCAFEVGAYDQGAHVTYLGPEGSHIGDSETIKDTARVLGRMYDGIEFRGFAQQSVETLAAFSGVPVWNGLTDQWHPTQMLADILTMRDHTDEPLDQVAYCYLGDARNNTANSLLVTGALLGMDVRVAAPKDLWPSPEVQTMAARLAAGSGARVHIGDDVASGVEGADFVYTDVWVSMGEAVSEWKDRIHQLLPYQVNAATLKATGNPDVKFMHCLPALHNTDTQLGRKIATEYHLDALEVTDEVFESPASVVFDEAENRLHTIKAAMVATIGTDVRLVVAVGGNALLERGEVPRAEIQEKHAEAAVTALAPLARDHQVVVTHGNGPQVGLLANESAADPALPYPYPLDVLGAQTQGMIGYFLLQAFENALPGRRVVSLIGQTEVASDDPAFEHPTKFVGPQYNDDDGHRVAALRGWQLRLDGTSWRRVVASPEPLALVELPTIRALVGSGAIVICAGGGGIPVTRGDDGLFRGAEAVIDKDRTAALLARDLDADALLILTDVANVELDFGTTRARPIGRTTPEAIRAEPFPPGSMGPKVEAACRFVEATGKPAMIGSLDEAGDLLRGTRGTIIEPSGPLGSQRGDGS